MVQDLSLPKEGFAKLPQVLEAIPVSKSTWFRGIASGKYPKPVKIGIRASAWRVEEIRQCMASLSEEQTPGANPNSSVIARRKL